MDQTGDMRDATHDDIMKKAKAKFDLLVKSGKWGAKSPDQEKIIAFEAQVKELKDLKLSAQLIRKLEEDENEKRKSEGENEDHQSHDSPNKQFQNQDDKWMKIPQRDDESKHKRVGKKTWHWCVHRMKWTVHKPENCRLGKGQSNSQDNQDGNQDDKQETIASQATYADTLAKLAHFYLDK